MKEHTESQKKQLLNDLLLGVKITALDGLKYGCLNVRNRISELGRDGYDIAREMIEVKTKFGEKRVMRYWLPNKKRLI